MAAVNYLNPDNMNFTPVSSANPLPVTLAGTGGSGAGPPYPATPLGYQQITVLTASTALTVPTGATYAIIMPEAQAVRFRDDGVAPTATVGFPLQIGAELVSSGNLAAIRFIQQAASAILNVSYYK